MEIIEAIMKRIMTLSIQTVITFAGQTLEFFVSTVLQDVTVIQGENNFLLLKRLFVSFQSIFMGF